MPTLVVFAPTPTLAREDEEGAGAGTGKACTVELLAFVMELSIVGGAGSPKNILPMLVLSIVLLFPTGDRVGEDRELALAVVVLLILLVFVVFSVADAEADDCAAASSMDRRMACGVIK